MAGVQRVKLNNLNTNLKNALIVGIIIGKSSPRKIGSKKKNGDSRGVTTFTLRDSDVDTINMDIWGSEYFVNTLYERFLVGDVVEISSPKICIKSGDNELYRPQVSSPFYLSLNEGVSDVGEFSGDTSPYLPLLHIPSKPASGYCGLAEVMKCQESDNIFVDLLVVVKSVKPIKTIRTKTGTEMSVRSVEIMDNTTPAALILDIFDMDSIQRAAEWRPLESVLFVADARVAPRGLRAGGRTVLTHQPHTPDAEALRLYIRNQTNTRGWEAGAWAAWGGAPAAGASAAAVRASAAAGPPAAAVLHALLTHLPLDDLLNDAFISSSCEELRVRFSDHTGELGANIPITVLEDALGYSVQQLKSMTAEDRAAVSWKLLLEQCVAKLAVNPPRVVVLALRRASPADPIPLY